MKADGNTYLKKHPYKVLCYTGDESAEYEK